MHPQQRMSLYAMNSGLVDMLAPDGMDLDTFLATAGCPADAAITAAAGAAGGSGGAAAGGSGACGGDWIIPVAPGSRTSIRWIHANT